MKSQTLLATALLLALAGCKRGGEEPVAPPSATPQAPAPATPPAAPTPPAQPPTAAPAGPHMELEAPEYRVAVNLAPGAFSLEIRGAGEFHVNEQYPIAVELTPENGTMDKRSLRRADAAELTAAVARFQQPFTAGGAGATVRGNVRFGMCRAEQCGFYNREFAVALP